jgi:hypothetical protein
VSQAAPSRAAETSRRELDEQIESLNLPVCRPESFHYLAPLDEYKTDKPYKCQLPAACFETYEMDNLQSCHYPTTIYDVSGHEDIFTLARSGFEFAKSPVPLRDWSDDAAQCEYLPQIADWLKSHLGCESVFCYDYNVRKVLEQS